ncbi:MAG: phosphoribosylanthranilate isomerase [Planctomycetes bacterium]|jgi:phosphoribosylanthranilate isomerase|nr:phosphoribosylanthranilate isomerase [Planctomycetota bacterium]
MMITKVKICGITNYDDAAAAMDMGADLLGFNFCRKSPRYIKPELAAQIIRKLPAFIDVSGVFVNSSLDELREIAALCQLDWVQLHGDENTEFCRWLSYDSAKTMKALRIKTAEDLQQVNGYSTDAILLDAFDPKRYGGTGATFDWNIIGHIGRRIFLAGGINPGNAAKALELGVYGIDVCSGVEAEPGKKDHKKMKALFDSIRHLRA